MVAGRELDALMAEHVENWTSIEHIKDDVWVGVSPDGWRRPVPDYSTEIKDAWAVVERLVGPAMSRNDETGEWEASCSTKQVSPYDGWRMVYAIAATTPLAICKAALLAVLGL